jgi:chitin synthase
MQAISPTALDDINWYNGTFLPKMKQFHIGPLLWDTNVILSTAQALE